MTRTALVVGGSGGIGSAICRRLAADGLQVIVGYRRDGDGAEGLAATLPGTGHGVVQIDVGEAPSIEAAAAAVSERTTRLDVLVNGAGITRPVAHDDLDGLDDGLVDDIFRVNWRGSFATIRALRGLLDAADAPVIVNISSIAGTTGQGSNVAYCASKAALDSLTRSLGRALAPHIRVVSVAPGWVMGEYAERMPPQVIDTQRAATPMGRLATADDVASTVAAVVTDLPFTTGAVIPVDGGRPLGTT